jgi:hypothetical protein
MFACSPSQTQFNQVQRMYAGDARRADEIAVLRAPYSRRDKQGVAGDLGAARSVSLYQFDGADVPRSAPLGILPGEHRVSLWTRWSNGFSDLTELRFVAENGKRYLIGVYELRPGQDPATADFSEKSTYWSEWWNGVGEGALLGIAMALLPIVLLVMVIAEQKGRPQTTELTPGEVEDVEAEPGVWPESTAAPRLVKPSQTISGPFEDCCFVWIQEEDSGAIVAGTAPRGHDSSSVK